MLHLNNKQNNTNPIISRQHCPSAEKQTNKKTQHKSHPKLTQTTGQTLGGQKPKGRNKSTLKPGKEDLKHNKLKKIAKAEKYYTNEGTN